MKCVSSRMVAGAALTLCFTLILSGSARAQKQVYANPDWNIELTDYGYSDVLIYTSGQFPAGFDHEMISGEWAAAISYESIPLPFPEESMWLEPNFVAPNWATNSTFNVVTSITVPADLDGDGLPEGFSEISNGTVTIRIDYDMVDTIIGTPMGLNPGFAMSNRYVLLQTYTVTNIAATDLFDVSLFQFLAGHPANTFIPTVTAVWDPTFYGPFPLDLFQQDVTQFATNTGDPSGGHTGYQFEEHINFGAAIVPGDWGLGHYPSNFTGKPPVGNHIEVETDSLGNQSTYGPAEVAGSQRFDYPAPLPAGGTESFVVEVILTVRSQPICMGLLDICIELDPGIGDPDISISKGGCVSIGPDGPYDVITGDLAAVSDPGAGAIDLGAATCQADQLVFDKLTYSSSTCDPVIQFFLARSDTQIDYGFDTLTQPRSPATGDCP